MKQKRLAKAVNIGRSTYNHKNVELIFLYEDGTWEKIFKYQWTDPISKGCKCFIVDRLTGLTKEQAIAKLQEQYNNGKTEGTFI